MTYKFKVKKKIIKNSPDDSYTNVYSKITKSKICQKFVEMIDFIHILQTNILVKRLGDLLPGQYNYCRVRQSEILSKLSDSKYFIIYGIIDIYNEIMTHSITSSAFITK